jgi:high affinity Mn2+ porin
MILSFKRSHAVKAFFICLSFHLLTLAVTAQPIHDSTLNRPSWNFHFQNTVIFQYHPAFHADYTGENSLVPTKESPTSVSATLFIGTRLWKGASAFYNPEISGGSGFSSTRGLAGFPNGEVYRVDNPAPKIYTGRLFINQIIPLSGHYEATDDEANQLPGNIPDSYLSISAGKFSVIDFFDDNKFSHDPRSQFYNWALMGNGAWDYPANTRGYTYGLVTEFIKPGMALRFAVVMMPVEANGSVMDHAILHSRAEALEFEHAYTLGTRTGKIRIMAYLNQARMGNYANALEWGITHHVAPEIDSVKSPGRSKYGFGINMEHNLTDQVGVFLRASWNDGHNETWVFTEIDKAFSAGIQLNGELWKRKSDHLGFAVMANGISKNHRDYLKAGGYGFIIGDGNLNYRPEIITEIYYSYRLGQYPFRISPDYQFALNPAYNADRGPVHIFGIRAHVDF